LKDQKKIENMAYEEAVKRLEEIVRLLEEAEISLEESLALFQEGITLSRYCRDKLAEIEYRVDYLLKEEQKSLEKDEPVSPVENANGDDL